MDNTRPPYPLGEKGILADGIWEKKFEKENEKKVYTLKEKEGGGKIKGKLKSKGKIKQKEKNKSGNI